jgi:uncharacterized membrane protein YdjX (TVP38/TMEM64 family)
MEASRKRWVWAGLAAAVVALAVALWLLLPVSDWIEGLQDRLRDLGAWGAILFVLIFIVAVVALVPGTLLTISAGVAYGFWGAGLALFASTVGAALAFLIGRYLVRERVQRWVGAHRHVRAVEEAVNDEGWKAVGLLRLSPLVPFNVQNYALGVTRIPFTHYVAATFVGIAPGTLLDTYIGTLGKGAGDRSPLEWTFLGAGLVASAVLVWLIGRKAKAKLTAAR